MPKITNINWGPEDYRKMVASVPPLIRVSDFRELVETLWQAQNCLEAGRRRVRASIYSTCKKPKHAAQTYTEIQLAAKYLSLDISSPAVNAPNPHWPPKRADAWRFLPRAGEARASVAKPAPRDSRRRDPAVSNINKAAHEARAKRDKNIRYSRDEWTALAHDPEVKLLLSEGGFSIAKLIDATMRAQVRQLPPERQRVRAEFMILARRVRSTNLEDQLRKHVKFQPRKVVPLPVLSEPPVRLAMSADLAPAGNAAEATIAAPATMPPALPRSSVVAAPSGPLGALSAALSVVAECLGAVPAPPTVEEMRETMRSILSEQLGLLGQAIDGQVRRSVRAEVLALLGGDASEAEPMVHESQAELPLAGASMPIPPRRRVDVIGMHGPSIAVIKRELNGEGELLDVRYIEQEHQFSKYPTAPVVIMATKFISHPIQDRIRKSGAQLIYANGGPQSVVAALRSLTHH